MICDLIHDQLYFDERKCERQSKNLRKVNVNMSAKSIFCSEHERKRIPRLRRERKYERERGKTVIH